MKCRSGAAIGRLSVGLWVSFQFVFVVVSLSSSSMASLAMPLERSLSMAMPGAGGGCAGVRWTVDTEARKWRVQFESAVESEWVGFGLSEFGSMKGADIMLVKMRHHHEEEEPTFEIQDLISVDFAKPKMDTLQNVELIHASLTDDGRIRAEVERSLDTCDADDIAVEPHKQWVVCASGQLDDNGEIAYHGPLQTSSAFVNLLLDEELLFDRILEEPGNSNGSISMSLDQLLGGSSNNTSASANEFITARVSESSMDVRDKDGSTLTMPLTPFPVDLQLPPNMSIDSSVQTHFICTTFTLPKEVRVVAYEDVWGSDGRTLHTPDVPPSYLHHTLLFKCDSEWEPTGRAETYFDCVDMPACQPMFGSTKGTGRVQLPPGIHLPLDPGNFVMQVHYENVLRSPIPLDDRLGLRLWIEPPLLPSRTVPGQVLLHAAQHDSIRIPADPEQRDYELQFLISAEATKAMLPPDGVQVFSTKPHMHYAGLRARLEHIRNGTHVQNIFDTKSYDFNKETPTRKRYKLMPGDALLMTCVYRPLPDRDLVGGYHADAEMCVFGMAVAPKIPGYDIGIGFMVRPEDSDYRNTYAGEIPEAFVNPPYEIAQFSPLPSRRGGYKSLKRHRENLCELVIRDDVNFPKTHSSDPGITASLVIIGAFFFVYLAYRVWKPLSKVESERHKRNTVIYLGQLLYGTIALPIVLYNLIEYFPSKTSYEAVNPDLNTLPRFLIYTQYFLYLLELFYRIDVRLELILHHLTTATIGITLTLMIDRAWIFELCFKTAYTLMLMAFTEQPIYLTLILKNFGYAEKSRWWYKLCYGSAVFNMISKTILTILAVLVMVRSHTGEEASWRVASHSFSQWMDPPEHVNQTVFAGIVSTLLVGLTISQGMAGLTLFGLASKYRRIHTSMADLDKHKPAGSNHPDGSTGDSEGSSF
jgi:hypothetical protein